MDISKLNNFIGMTKKADAALTKKLEFQKELLDLLIEESYSEKTEIYIFEGLQLGSPASYVEFLKTKSDDEKLKAFFEFTSGQLFYKNEKGISFKLMIALLGYMLNEKLCQGIIEDIIRRLNGLSKNKENKRFSDISKTIEKYFLNVLKPDAELPELSKTNLTPVALDKFRSLMFEALGELSKSDNANQPIINKIMQWLSDNSSNTLIVSSADSEKNYCFCPG